MPNRYDVRSARRRWWGWLRRRTPVAWRTRIARALGRARGDAWEAARVAAERDPMLETYRASRPAGPLRHRLGVTVSPAHPDAAALTAAARELGGDVAFFDPDAPDWPERVRAADLEGHLVHLRHGTQVERGLDDDRLTLLHLLGHPAWPTPVEAYLYEDKARAAWLLAALGVPQVPTRTFVRLADAEAYLRAAAYPLVVKTRTGAGGSGVERVDAPGDALALARSFLAGRFQRRASDPRDADYGYLLVQPFLADAREHRVIRLGDVWFAHGKRRAADDWRYSGSGIRDWELPSVAVLDAGHAVAERLGMSCGAIDLLVEPDGAWSVLEVQTWYEGFRAAQMDVEGVPSYAVRREVGWDIVPGAPHVHRGHALRLVALDRWLSARADGRAAPLETASGAAPRETGAGPR